MQSAPPRAPRSSRNASCSTRSPASTGASFRPMPQASRCSPSARLIDLRVTGRLAGHGTADPCSRSTRRTRRRTWCFCCRAGRLDRRSTATKWFRALEGAGDVVEVFPVRARDLPRWIADRGAARGVAFERDAAAAARGAQRGEPARVRAGDRQAPPALPRGGRSRWTTSWAPWRTAPGSGRSTSSIPRWKATARGSARILRCPARGGGRADPRPGVADVGDPRRVRHRGRPRGRRAPRRRAAGRFGAWWRRRHLVQRALVAHAPPGLGPAARTAEGVDRMLKGRPARSGAVGSLVPRRRLGRSRTAGARDVPGETAAGRAL